jgi:hypothetical protein
MNPFKGSSQHFKHTLIPEIKSYLTWVGQEFRCSIKGHKDFQTDESGFHCNMCFTTWYWDNTHDWIKSDKDVDLFLDTVAVSHKRKWPIHG